MHISRLKLVRNPVSSTSRDVHLHAGRARVFSAAVKPTSRQYLRQSVLRASGGSREEDLDFAVFRFTLGIPGFNDDLIPRVVGLLGLVLLSANHFAAGSAAGSAALTRAEVLGAFIAALCLAAPSLQQRLAETHRITKGVSSNQTAPVFLLSSNLTAELRQELAWASFALLRNTAASGMMFIRQGRVLLARGSLGPVADGNSSEEALKTLSSAVQTAPGFDELLDTRAEGSTQLFLPDLTALRAAGIKGWSFVPLNTQSALIVTITPASAGTSADKLLLFSDQPGALSQRQRSWAAAIASKCHTIC